MSAESPSSRSLNAAALKVAHDIGPITFNPRCDPMDVVKHLTSDCIVQKLGL